MGSNKMGIGSPIPPLRDGSGCDCLRMCLQLIRFSIGHEEAGFCAREDVCGVEH